MLELYTRRRIIVRLPFPDNRLDVAIAWDPLSNEYSTARCQSPVLTRYVGMEEGQRGEGAGKRHDAPMTRR